MIRWTISILTALLLGVVVFGALASYMPTKNEIKRSVIFLNIADRLEF